uniref:Uncharacterized protein n=1 Tax=Arundo donax TaxID=35708 RepID=A0A0A9GWG7_ARUDO
MTHMQANGEKPLMTYKGSRSMP